ncbi:MAG: GNAT family N-acetyltransferase [Pseudomonadota bacterium]
MAALSCDVAPVAGALQVRVIDKHDAATALAPAWGRLAREASAPAFFQSPEWCLYVWAARMQVEDAPRVRPSLIAVFDGTRLVALLPIVLRRAFGCTIAEDLTEPFGQYSDALIDRQVDRHAALDLMWDAIKGLDVDALMFRKVRADATIAPWLGAEARPFGECRHAPFVDLGAFESLANYRKTITSKTRKNLRNYRNRLGRDGTLTFETLTGTTERAELTRRCLALRAMWLAQSGLSSMAFQHPAFTRIVAGLADGAPGAPQLRVTRLRHAPNDGPAADIAMQWGFVYAGRYYAFMSAKNAAYDAYSPGRLHLEDIIASCADTGIGVVDFLVPDMPYKATWATGRMTVQGYAMPVTVRGRAVVDGWHGMVRPALKHAFYQLPSPMRRLATGLDLRMNTRNS